MMIKNALAVSRHMSSTLRELRLMSRNLRRGLYYFFCHRSETPVPCRFRWWRGDCISCLVRAGRELAAWRQRW